MNSRETLTFNHQDFLGNFLEEQMTLYQLIELIVCGHDFENFSPAATQARALEKANPDVVPNGSELNEDWINKVVSKLNGGVLVELGSGQGDKILQIMGNLNNKDWDRVFGFDINPRVVQKANTRARKHSAKPFHKVNVVADDAVERMREILGEKEIGLVLMQNLLANVIGERAERQLLANLSKIVKQGARVMVADCELVSGKIRDEIVNIFDGDEEQADKYIDYWERRYANNSKAFGDDLGKGEFLVMPPGDRKILEEADPETLQDLATLKVHERFAGHQDVDRLIEQFEKFGFRVVPDSLKRQVWKSREKKLIPGFEIEFEYVGVDNI